MPNRSPSPRTESSDNGEHVVDVDDPVAVDITGWIRRTEGCQDLQDVVYVHHAVSVDIGPARALVDALHLRQLHAIEAGLDQSPGVA